MQVFFEFIMFLFAPVGVLGWSPWSLNLLWFRLTHLVAYALVIILSRGIRVSWIERVDLMISSPTCSFSFSPLFVSVRVQEFSGFAECAVRRRAVSREHAAAVRWAAEAAASSSGGASSKRQAAAPAAANGKQQAGASAGGPRAREAAQLGTTASRPDQELVPRIHKVSRISSLFPFFL